MSADACKQFRLPDVGEGLTEAEILKWYVSRATRSRSTRSIVRGRDGEGGRRAAHPRTPGWSRAAGRPRARPWTWRRRSSRSTSTRTAAPGVPTAAQPHRGRTWCRRCRGGAVEPGLIGAGTGRPTAVLVGYGPRSVAPSAARARRRARRAASRAPAQTDGASRSASRAAPGTPARAGRPEPAAGCAGRPRPSRRGRRPTGAACACWPSRRCASSPRTSASTWPRSTPTGADGVDHPRRRRGGAAPRPGREPAATPAAAEPRSPAATTPAAGAAYPDQGRPQAHRRGDGGQRVHRAARHRVPHGGHDPRPCELRGPARRAPGVRRASRSPRCCSSPRRCCSRSSRHPRSTRPGTRPPRRSWSRSTSTSASRRRPRAVWSCRTSRTPAG